MPLERSREIWAAVERCRRERESWIEACEREMYAAIVAEGHPQTMIAEYMSETKVGVNRRLGRLGLRPRDRQEADRAAAAGVPLGPRRVRPGAA